VLRHRKSTPKGRRQPLRNVWARSCQLVYVTPPLLIGAFAVARDLHRRRDRDAASRLLWSLTVTSLPLVLLCCFSRVAEPHWVAPLYLALPLHLARRAPQERLVGAGVARSAVATGAVAAALAHAWVLLPVGPRWLGTSYEARYDLANDLYAWEAGLPVLRRALGESIDADLTPIVVVGPHWTVCAQVHAALPPGVLVGCHAEVPDDFARWLPASTWRRAPIVLYVTDDRFDSLPRELSDHKFDFSWQAEVHRGGALVRRITIRRLVASALAHSVPDNERGDHDTLAR
jgi:hypothetical protein